MQLTLKLPELMALFSPDPEYLLFMHKQRQPFRDTRARRLTAAEAKAVATGAFDTITASVSHYQNAAVRARAQLAAGQAPLQLRVVQQPLLSVISVCQQRFKLQPKGGCHPGDVCLL